MNDQNTGTLHSAGQPPTSNQPSPQLPQQPVSVPTTTYPQVTHTSDAIPTPAVVTPINQPAQLTPNEPVAPQTSVNNTRQPASITGISTSYQSNPLLEQPGTQTVMSAPETATTIGATSGVNTSPPPVVMADFSNSQPGSPQPTKFYKKKLVVGLAILFIVIVSGTAAILLKHILSNGGGADQTNPTKLSNAFVYDITHSKASAAYSLTIPNTGIQANYSSNGFATNVHNLSSVILGDAKEKSQKTISITITTGGATSIDTNAQKSVPQVTTTYTITTKDELGTIAIDAIQNLNKWTVEDIEVSPDSGDLKGIFDGSVDSYLSSNGSSPSSTATPISGDTTTSTSSQTPSSSSCTPNTTYNLVCYAAVKQNTTTAAYASAMNLSYATLFYPDATENNDSNGAPQLFNSEAELQIFNDSQPNCQTNVTSTFTYTSHGSNETACYYLYQDGDKSYVGNISSSGQTYQVFLDTSFTLSTAEVQAIFESISIL